MTGEFMKTNKTNNKPVGDPGTKTVRIEFTHATATRIGIAGTFNDWRPGATEMVPVGNGRWLKELILAPGVYEYRLVVDGEWMPDPGSSETVTNPFGEMNSVVRVNRCAS